MKKIAFLVFTSILLASCSGSGTDTADTNLSQYEGNGFTIQVPKTWIKVDSSSAPTPGNGKLEAAWSSTEIASGFANNLVILSSKMENNKSSKAYSIINNKIASGDYLEYQKLDETDFTFENKNGSDDTNADSMLYVFTAKYNPQTPIRKFLQTSRVCGNEVYMMTIGLNLDASDLKKYEAFLTSFECSAKKTEK